MQEENSAIQASGYEYASGARGFTVNLWLAIDSAGPPLLGRQWVFVQSNSSMEAPGQHNQVSSAASGQGMRSAHADTLRCSSPAALTLPCQFWAAEGQGGTMAPCRLLCGWSLLLAAEACPAWAPAWPAAPTWGAALPASLGSTSQVGARRRMGRLGCSLAQCVVWWACHCDRWLLANLGAAGRAQAAPPQQAWAGASS